MDYLVLREDVIIPLSDVSLPSELSYSAQVVITTQEPLSWALLQELSGQPARLVRADGTALGAWIVRRRRDISENSYMGFVSSTWVSRA